MSNPTKNKTEDESKEDREKKDWKKTIFWDENRKTLGWLSWTLIGILIVIISILIYYWVSHRLSKQQLNEQQNSKCDEQLNEQLKEFQKQLQDMKSRYEATIKATNKKLRLTEQASQHLFNEQQRQIATLMNAITKSKNAKSI